VRETIEKAKKQQFFNAPGAILFIDEIHRFSKSQQDSLLGAVESGTVTLIGATTENPSFEVISPLLSRCQVYVLKPLNKSELMQIVKRALKKDGKLKELDVRIDEDQALLRYSGGDARKLLNVLELVVNNLKKQEATSIMITNERVTQIVQENLSLYDKGGEQHYDIISAFIKSVRGSDPNAAVYWLARMVEGGEDPKFIARRLAILAAEDIGLANPNALLLATSCFDAVNLIGWPESRIILAEATIYLATSPKSNSAYNAINEAQLLVKKSGNLPVPLHLRNAPTQLMKELGYGHNYKYSHDYKKNFVEENYLPDEIEGTGIYQPQNNSKENEILKTLRMQWKNRYNY
jgi:putative ATPase